MPVFVWKGKDKNKKTKKGEIEAPSEDAVRAELIRIKITDFKIKPKPKDIFENVSFM